MPSRWTLHDPVSGSTYVMQVNPNSEVTTAGKTLTYTSTAAPSDALLLYEGSDAGTTLTLSGTLLSQPQYSAFAWWYQLRRQVLLTDDLGRQRWVYFSQWSPTRVRSATYPFKFTYQLSLYVLSELLPVGSAMAFNADPTIG